MFKDNPNIALPGQEHGKNVEWIDHYKGHRLYNHHENGRWHWNMEFKAIPGEFYFDDAEQKLAQRKSGFIVIEPNVPWWKPVAPNKDWGEDKYRQFARNYLIVDTNLVQFKHRNTRRIIPDAKLIEHDQFRKSIAVLSKAALLCWSRRWNAPCSGSGRGSGSGYIRRLYSTGDYGI